MTHPLEATEERTGATSKSVTMEALQTLRRPMDAVISPDGRRIASSVSTAACTDPPRGPEARIWVAELPERPRQVTQGPGLDCLPRWSPDGRFLAFASDREHPGRLSPYLLRSGAGEALPAGEVGGSVEELIWSANGRFLLVLAADLGSDRAGAHTATRILERELPDADPIVRRPKQAWRRLLLLDVVTHAVKIVGPLGLNIWEVDWDGVNTAVAVVSDDPSESSWYNASLVVIDLEEGKVTATYQPESRPSATRLLSAPRVSPDGRRVAFIEGVASDRANLPGGSPRYAQLGGDSLEPRHIADSLEVAWVSWRDTETLLWAAWQGLGSSCGLLSLDGTYETLWAQPATIGVEGVAPFTHDANCSKFAAVWESTNEPPEVVLLELGASSPGLQQISDFNAALRSFDLPEWQTRRWPAPDGQWIEGLLALPTGREPKGLPLVVIVHGGPVSASSHQWTHFGYPLLWTAVGYAVFLPNPRGSRGWGPDFAQAVVGDMGGAELQDILSGVESLVADGIVDTRRVGILGKSHGGFMTAWAATQTERFAAAVPIACISNWISFHNTTNIGRWDELFLEANPYDSGSAYHSRSPIMHVGKIRTPTLVIHGACDLCTPVGQAQELYQGIADTGHAEVELVIFPREGHEFLERAHQIDLWDRCRAFFDKHVRSQQDEGS